jgi:hypothetical protein
MVKALDYWIAYRQACPTAQWVGQRNHEAVTAKPPSDKPETYLRGAPTAAPSAPTPPLEDDDIPFAWNVTSEVDERWIIARRERDATR